MIARTTIAAVMLCGLPAVVSADINITPTATEIAFGPIDVRGTVPQHKTAAVLVRSTAAWALTATLEAAPGMELGDLMREQIEVKSSRSDWMPMIAGVPVMISSGEATTEAGTLAAVELRVKPGDSQPGLRRLQIRFGSSGAADGAAVRLSYEIPLSTVLDSDPRPFESPAVNPARAGLYPYERHRYIIRSNVAWVVEVTVSEMKSRGTVMPLPPNTLVLVGQGGELTPIVEGQPVIVATGNPTSGEGLPLEVQLAIRVGSDAALAGGEYSADIRVSARATAHAVQAATNGRARQ